MRYTVSKDPSVLFYLLLCLQNILLSVLFTKQIEDLTEILLAIDIFLQLILMQVFKVQKSPYPPPKEKKKKKK